MGPYHGPYTIYYHCVQLPLTNSGVIGSFSSTCSLRTGFNVWVSRPLNKIVGPETHGGDAFGTILHQGNPLLDLPLKVYESSEYRKS